MFAVARTCILRAPALSAEQQLTYDRAGISIGRSQGPQMPLHWYHLRAYAETENLFLLDSPWSSVISSLFAYKYSFGYLYAIPKRAFALPELEEFRELLRSNIPKASAQFHPATAS
jgi:hypothetical protein